MLGLSKKLETRLGATRAETKSVSDSVHFRETAPFVSPTLMGSGAAASRPFFVHPQRVGGAYGAVSEPTLRPGTLATTRTLPGDACGFSHIGSISGKEQAGAMLDVSPVPYEDMRERMPPVGRTCFGMWTLCIVLLLTPVAVEAATIDTVAGTGVPGFSGDGGPATERRP